MYQKYEMEVIKFKEESIFVYAGTSITHGDEGELLDDSDG